MYVGEHIYVWRMQVIYLLLFPVHTYTPYLLPSTLLPASAFGVKSMAPPPALQKRPRAHNTTPSFAERYGSCWLVWKRCVLKEVNNKQVTTSLDDDNGSSVVVIVVLSKWHPITLRLCYGWTDEKGSAYGPDEMTGLVTARELLQLADAMMWCIFAAQ